MTFFLAMLAQPFQINKLGNFQNHNMKEQCRTNTVCNRNAN